LINEQFVGCWKLISHEFKTSDGRVLHPWGDDPAGTVIFDNKGNFSAQIMRRDRPEFAADVPTDEEVRKAYGGYMAYFGTFEMDEKEKKLINHVEGSLNPNWVGGDQIRYYDFAGDKMTLTTAPIKAGALELVGTLVWEKIE